LKKISEFKSIGIDTNIFIYFFEQNPRFGTSAEKIFRSLADNEIRCSTNIIALTELLAFKGLSEKAVKDIERRLYDVPNLQVSEVNREIAIKAAKIRRNYGFRLADSLQLATAIVNKVGVYVSNDLKLKKFKELKVISLDEI
jgi:predicted nucleic acid-binding protein